MKTSLHGMEWDGEGGQNWGGMGETGRWLGRWEGWIRLRKGVGVAAHAKSWALSWVSVDLCQQQSWRRSELIRSCWWAYPKKTSSSPNSSVEFRRDCTALLLHYHMGSWAVTLAGKPFLLYSKGCTGKLAIPISSSAQQPSASPEKVQSLILWGTKIIWGWQLFLPQFSCFPFTEERVKVQLNWTYICINRQWLILYVRWDLICKT